MNKIYCIGECALDIVFDASAQPVGAMPGGRIANAAMLTAGAAVPTAMVSEASADTVGDLVVGRLAATGVDTAGIDRITEGNTPTLLYLPAADGKMTITRYENYPDECFDVVWPRFAEGDVVLYGGYYAIDPRMRRRMAALLANAVERKARMVYLPGFLPSQAPRITRVMPAILDNLEIANLVITRSADLKAIFGTANAGVCYRDHIDYYGSALLNVDGPDATLYHDNQTFEAHSTLVPTNFTASLVWNAGIAAGACAELARGNTQRAQIVDAAVKMADKAVSDLIADWQKIH